MDPGFVIGGAPKCATTAIFDYLSQHPDIFASEPKEPHFFASATLGRRIMQGDYTKREYQSLFAKRRAWQVSGEGSTHYLCHAEAVAPFMAEHVPDVRLVFCLRDPADRAWSHFLFRYSMAGPYTAGGVGRSSDFQTFLGDPEIFAMGDYATGLEAFLGHFREEQIQLIFFEDIVRDTAGCLSRICDHIGVDPRFPFDLSRRANETAYPRHPFLMPVADRLFVLLYRLASEPRRPELLKRRHDLLFSIDAPKKRFSEQDRKHAIDIYRPSIERLSAITGRDLSEWLDIRV